MNFGMPKYFRFRFQNFGFQILGKLISGPTLAQPLVLDAYDISAERSKTEDVIRHIEKLMYDANEKHVNIKAFISDSAGHIAHCKV